MLFGSTVRTATGGVAGFLGKSLVDSPSCTWFRAWPRSRKPLTLRRLAIPAGRVCATQTMMKARTDYLTFHLPERVGFVNITPDVQHCVTESGIREGLVLVNAMHITAS